MAKVVVSIPLLIVLEWCSSFGVLIVLRSFGIRSSSSSGSRSTIEIVVGVVLFFAPRDSGCVCARAFIFLFLLLVAKRQTRKYLLFDTLMALCFCACAYPRAFPQRHRTRTDSEEYHLSIYRSKTARKRYPTCNFYSAFGHPVVPVHCWDFLLPVIGQGGKSRSAGRETKAGRPSLVWGPFWARVAGGWVYAVAGAFIHWETRKKQPDLRKVSQ